MFFHVLCFLCAPALLSGQPATSRGPSASFSGPPTLPPLDALPAVPETLATNYIPILPFWVQSLLEPHVHCERHLDAVELFAGQAEITQALQAAFFTALGVDASDGRAESNMLSYRGFLNALHLIMRIKPKGLLWLAPPCSSWVYMSSSWHKRGKRNRHRGATRWCDIREANSLGCIVAILVLVASWRQVYYILEQPKGSKLLKFRPLQDALRNTGASTLTTYLRSFCPTFPIKKPLSLCYTAPWAVLLSRPMPTTPRASINVYIKDAVTGQVTGKGGLAETAAYPPEFARAVPSLVLLLS